MRGRETLLALVVLLITTPGLAQRADRSAPPPLGPTPQLRVPPVQERSLSNGLTVWIVEKHEVPIVAIHFVVRSGSASDPEGKFGVASLVAAMLDEGAGERDALALSDAVDYVGASLQASSGTDASSVRLLVPLSRLAQALPLMADVALRPTFPPSELDRLRDERLVNLLQARDDPASIVATAFPRLLYGERHRFGTPSVGTPETVRHFTVEDLQTFYRGHYRPENAALLVVGDVTTDEVLTRLEQSFGAWMQTNPPVSLVSLPPAPELDTRRVFLIDKPGAAQSQIRIGLAGVARSTPDYFPLEVLNTILGGSFTSRLNQNLREDKGYTYGARSGFGMYRAAGPFQAAAGVQTDKTAESLTEFFRELNGILDPIPADEVDKAKNYLALGFPGEFETAGGIARQLEEVLVYDLPEDYLESYIPNVLAVTPADVERVARTYLHPDRMVVVVVGDAALVEQPIAALELGPIERVPLDQVMGEP